MTSGKSEKAAEVQKKRKEFYELSLPHMDSLYNSALRFTRNEVDAEDLVQDVYVRAFRFFHKFQRGTNFKAWIFKILTNTYINQYRKALKKPHQVDIEKIQYKYVEEQKPVGGLEIERTKDLNYERLFDDEIKEALDQLSPEFRIVVLLADVESFSYKEIAEIIGRPLGTVMSRLSRGRKYLQSYLEKYAVEGGFISKSKN